MLTTDVLTSEEIWSKGSKNEDYIKTTCFLWKVPVIKKAHTLLYNKLIYTMF